MTASADNPAHRTFTVRTAANTDLTVEGDELRVSAHAVEIHAPDPANASYARPVFVAPLDQVRYVVENSAKKA